MITPARIKSTRESLKLTKRELAKRIGVHESSINKYEKGLVDIPLSKITELARVLNVTESYLMGWEDNDKEAPQGLKIPVLGTVAAGIPIKVISERLGHSDTSITLSIYTHVTANMKIDLQNKLEKAFPIFSL